jgi:5,6-dimethylbenzimidazole synthase
MPAAPTFDPAFQHQFRNLLIWRRDVRRFQTQPLPPNLLHELIQLACLAPSVGLSEPWRFVQVSSPNRRQQIRDEFERANAEALAGYSGEQAALYSRLKLAGLDDAPVHLAVFSDPTTSQGSGLGRQTMPETLEYSVIGAISTLWLAARAHGLGLGWVSICSPERVREILSVPAEWRLIAYLCIGYPDADHDTPELQRAGWEHRANAATPLLER